MKYIAAYLLSKASGNDKPSNEDVEKILKAAGVEVDSAQVEAVVSKMNEKTLEETIEAGKVELAKVAGGAAPAASAAKTEAAAPVEEEKEEEAAPLDLGDMFDF